MEKLKKKLEKLEKLEKLKPYALLIIGGRASRSTTTPKARVREVKDITLQHSEADRSESHSGGWKKTDTRQAAFRRLFKQGFFTLQTRLLLSVNKACL